MANITKDFINVILRKRKKMKCIICGSEIDGNYNEVVCKTCERIIGSIKYRISKNEGNDEIIQKLRRNQFLESITDSELDNVDMNDIIEQIDDALIPRTSGEIASGIITPESVIVFSYVVANVINEFVQSFHGEMLRISQSEHNDRIALIETAEQQYAKACNIKEDLGRKQNILDNAEMKAEEACNSLKKEIKGNLDIIGQLPKSTLAKLFYPISIDSAKSSLSQLHESYTAYLRGVSLSIMIGIESKDTEHFHRIIKEESNFLKNLIQSKEYKRLLEFDDSNADTWDERIRIIPVLDYYLDQVETKEKV